MTSTWTSGAAGLGEYADVNGLRMYYEIHGTGGGQHDGGWQSEGRPAGGHALVILPGLTHYNVCTSPLTARATLEFLDAP